MTVEHVHDELVDRAPRAPVQRAALVLVCGLGTLVSLLLLVAEARSGTPLEIRDISHVEQDRVLSVRADVRNDSDVPRCPDIRGVARDSEGRDLAETVATAVIGDGRIEPGRSVSFEVEIRGLTRQQLDEELKDVTMYVYEPHRCGP